MAEIEVRVNSNTITFGRGRASGAGEGVRIAFDAGTLARGTTQASPQDLFPGSGWFALTMARWYPTAQKPRLSLLPLPRR
jgi:hypothetical protein